LRKWRYFLFLFLGSSRFLPKCSVLIWYIWRCYYCQAFFRWRRKVVETGQIIAKENICQMSKHVPSGTCSYCTQSQCSNVILLTLSRFLPNRVLWFVDTRQSPEEKHCVYMIIFKFLIYLRLCVYHNLVSMPLCLYAYFCLYIY